MSQVETKSISPLMPKNALQYFIDGESSYPLYLRATSIRSCLENIAETIFIHLIDDSRKNQWINLDLFDKLDLLSDFFPKNINDKLHKIRKLGNKGAHPKLHKQLEEEDINITLNDLSQICELTILSYFKKHGFIEHPWIPTIFSTLPPMYRVRILEQLLDINSFSKKELIEHQEKAQNQFQSIMSNPTLLSKKKILTKKEIKLDGCLLLIDKLAMAYLKSGDPIKGMHFIQDLHNKGYINNIFTAQMIEKLVLLEQSFHNLPISQNLEDTKNKLTKIIPVVKEEEKSLFITLFVAIILQNP